MCDAKYIRCSLTSCLPSRNLTQNEFRLWWTDLGEQVMRKCTVKPRGSVEESVAADGHKSKKNAVPCCAAPEPTTQDNHQDSQSTVMDSTVMVDVAAIKEVLTTGNDLCCRPELRINIEGTRPLGLPLKSGLERVSSEDWVPILQFINSKKWLRSTLLDDSDLADPLVNQTIAYGQFMLAFDFHLTENGPKLIEINTNAGGLASVFALSGAEVEKAWMRQQFYDALVLEYSLAGRSGLPKSVAIVDVRAEEQGLYTEMLHYAAILEAKGITTVVCSPEDLSLVDGKLLAKSKENKAVQIDLVYNRLTDFRFERTEHKILRTVATSGDVVVTPHPAVYARVADKRNLTQITDPVVPRTEVLSARPLESWQAEKKKWVFKPPCGAGSKGVYRGDKISNSKLQSLPGDTICQEYCPPSVSDDDESKFDLRVFTHRDRIIGIATRHFTGQVLEMKSKKSGFKAALPDGVCCFPML